MLNIRYYKRTLEIEASSPVWRKKYTKTQRRDSRRGLNWIIQTRYSES